VAVRRPVKGPEGQEIGYVFVFSDATRLKEMEEEVSRDRRLRAMGEMIAQIAHELRSPLGSLELFRSLLEMEEEVSRDRRLRAMGEMIAQIAHELRSPLGSLELFRSLLEREGGSPQGQEYLGHMATSIASMDRLVGNLLYHTRTPSLEEEEVDGRELVLRLSRDLSRMAASSSRDRTPPDIRALVPDSPLLLSGDGDLLYHALFNLATNALEAVMALPESPKKEEVFRRIRLECAQGLAGEVSFRVSDNGTGIASEIAERIFDPFFTTRAKGTGLGLSIVHNIAVAHGGDIRYAREDGWTVFVLTLPVVRPPGDRGGG
jgi:two-component system sensor histidine kinase FlrB